MGNKTTNAKARATQQTGVKDIVREFEKTTIKPNSTVRPRQAAPQVESSKLEVHTDNGPLEEEDVEYAPPKLKELPYESEVFPDGVLTYEGLKPENLFKGYYDHYYNKIDEDGRSAQERAIERQRQLEFQRGDEQMLRDLDEFDWSVGDVPESKNVFKVKKDADVPAVVSHKNSSKFAHRAPNTITSRKAAAALAMPAKAVGTSQAKLNKTVAAPRTQSFLLPRKKTVQPAAQTTLAVRERAAAVAASRSTLGYSKGRSALSSANRQPEPPAIKPRVLSRTASTASSGSDCTITPARFARTQASSELKKPEFLSIFDCDEEDGRATNIPAPDDSDDDFQLPTDF